MIITNWGGATAVIEHNGKRMLFDPWLDDGIFHGSWFHYPPVQVKPENMGRFDYVFISHIHEDHCSAGTIRHINRDAEVIIMDRHPNFVLNFLRVNNFEFKAVHLVKPRTPTTIAPNLVVDIVEADPAHELAHIIDSALVMKWDDYVIYNANDCKPYADGLRYIKQAYGTVDLALIPYAGGSGYPACYQNLSHDEKMKEKERIYTSGIASFIETIRFLEPKYFMPFADQYVIGGSRGHLNKYMPHPPSPGAVRIATIEAGLEERLLLLNSGQSFDLASNAKSPDDSFRDHTELDREAYVSQLAARPYDHEVIQMLPTVPIVRLLQHARSRLWVAQGKEHNYPQFSIYLDITDRQRRFCVTLNNESSVEVDWDAALHQPYLRISCSETLLILLLIGHVSWNIADAALFLDYERVPNVYSPSIYVLLNHLRV